MNFREYIRKSILKTEHRILELGPLNWPIVSKKDNPNAFFADIRSTEDIKKLYAANDYLKSTGVNIDVDTIVDIDYVIDGDYKKTFKNIEKFDVVILSHVIEHMPDIIFFFKDVLNILKKDGRLVIIYPDARYCFDHFRNGTSFIDAYDVYKNKKSNCNAVFDFTYNVVHENRPVFFWNDMNIVDILPENKFTDAIAAHEKAHNNEMPEDVHFWPFSDYQFIKFLYDMDRAGLLGLEISDFHETQNNSQEFMVILSPKKVNKINHKKYKDILGRISPTVKNIVAAKENQDLIDQVDTLEKARDKEKEEKGLIEKELENVYNSKRWKLITKVANMKNKLFK